MIIFKNFLILLIKTLIILFKFIPKFFQPFFLCTNTFFFLFLVQLMFHKNLQVLIPLICKDHNFILQFYSLLNQTFALLFLFLYFFLILISLQAKYFLTILYYIFIYLFSTDTQYGPYFIP